MTGTHTVRTAMRKIAEAVGVPPETVTLDDLNGGGVRVSLGKDVPLPDDAKDRLAYEMREAIGFRVRLVTQSGQLTQIDIMAPSQEAGIEALAQMNTVRVRSQFPQQAGR